ncbi:MAG: hypothetical protein KKE20_00355 [Nanoarchaeota archaeon]|nr:hypothetical protein [Nanoarchaeota archaeon]
MKKIIFILTVLAVLFAFAGCSRQDSSQDSVNMVITSESSNTNTGTADSSAKPSEPSPAEPAETLQEIVAEEPKPTEEPKTEFKGMEITCDEKQTLGYISCADIGEKAELTIRNTGRLGLNGVLVRYYDEGSNRLDEYSEMFSFPVGDQKVLSLSLSNQRLWKVEVFPITNSDVCINKQLVVIPITNCR